MPEKPDFEKTQKELMEAIRKMMAESRPGKSPAQEISREETEEKRRERRNKALKFEFKPKQVKKHLDRYVIKQDEAKRILATTVCDHYNHVRICKSGDTCNDYTKQNVILLGPTGVGKTYLIRSLAELIGVPFIKADATRFSETGYVGRDVDDLVRDLVQRAEGDIELAEYGIIYLDEVDKIARASNTMGRDVSGAGVQQGLLKLMEETEVPLRSPQDIQSQMEGLMEYQQTGKLSRPVVNTRHILFIVSGAFNGLGDIIKKRRKAAHIGFQATAKRWPDTSEVLRDTKTEDFIEYGFEPEFVGRLPVRAVLDLLSAEDLYRILTTSEGSILKQYVAAFEAYGIEMKFEEQALWEMAKQAAEEKTGARGLVTVLEKTLRDLKYELPSSKLRYFSLKPVMVKEPSEAVRTLLEQEIKESRKEITEAVASFADRFSAQTKMTIRFDDEAVGLIQKRVLEEDIPVAEFLEKLLSNYDYGLKLIQQKSPRDKFVITAEVIRNPNVVLDQWIKEAYEKGV